MVYPSIKTMAPQLSVTNLGRAVSFYKDCLGFSVQFYYDDFYAGISNGNNHIHLKFNDTLGSQNKSEQDPDIVFSVSDIKVFFENTKESGVVNVQPLRTMPYGMEFYIADPDGNILAFIQEN